MASGEEVAGECGGGWCVRRWLVWVAALPAAPLVSFFCFSFPMRDGVRLSPAVPIRRMRGYLNIKKKLPYISVVQPMKLYGVWSRILTAKSRSSGS